MCKATELQTFREYAIKNAFRLAWEMNFTGDSSIEEAGQVAAQEMNFTVLLSIIESLGLAHLTPEDALATLNDAVKSHGQSFTLSKPAHFDQAVLDIKDLRGSASHVSLMEGNVTVYLDNDQLKHQHKSHPIGTRVTHGGNKFNSTCDVAWHRANTLPEMLEWAKGLPYVEGSKQPTGQAEPRNGIHYEGHCLMANSGKYVLFHCYPSDGSKLLG
ncbi:hypothetical protein N7414_09040 [Pseudomonas sp. GD04087]|uniref:hypothetical protein n=1 Tax=unclassified Pseudomonas TaxID=196821 RepID=UPI0024478526|nr:MULTISPECIES: hypothetical protein [unclassified Pseudomonas]MDH0289258.1 hypothetical protein [Pseudomonas sp. GD04087]MDH1047891.1 hypothetical protein [Pseudomonas sp. GD03903]MDH1998574.1 hypothetical protein [Pseudomonas sp. GD03691]